MNPGDAPQGHDNEAINTPNGVPTSRPSIRTRRYAQLVHLQARVTAEISAIEAEIASEIEANKRARAEAEQAQTAMYKRRAAVCGTDGGYYRHRRKLKEEACGACKLAHRVAERERTRNRVAAKGDDAGMSNLLENQTERGAA